MLTNLPQRLRQYLLGKFCLSIAEFVKIETSEEEYQWYESNVRIRNKEQIRDFVVEFSHLSSYLRYTRKDNAKRILIKEFVRDTDYIINNVETEGRPIEKIMLTMNTAHRFTAMSRTSKGKEISAIFVRLIEVMADYTVLSTYFEKMEFMHNTLVEVNKNYPVVYLANIFVEDENEHVICIKKLGYSENVVERQKQLRTQFKTNCWFTHIWKCVRSHKLEESLKKEQIFQENRFKQSINGFVSTETLLLNDNFSESMLIELIETRLPEYNIISEDAFLKRKEFEMKIIEAEKSLAELKLESEKIELETNKVNFVVNYASEYQRRVLPEGQNVQLHTLIQDPPIPFAVYELDSRKNSRGYKIQKIDANDLKTVVSVYESAIDVTRKVEGVSKAALLKAMSNNTIYKGFRWSSVKHGEDENIVKNLVTTQPNRRVVKGMVAKINRNDTEIVEVFSNQKEASEKAGIKSRSAICNAIKNNTLSQSHFYRLWDECSNILKEKYISVFGDPEKPDNNGIKVDQIHPLTKQIIKTFPTMESVTKFFGVSRATIRKSITENKTCKGFLWRERK